MSDLNHPETQRGETAVVLLSLLGLAGLAVLIAFFMSDSGLWPSFSHERVYAAHAVLAETETPITVAPKPVEVEAVFANTRESAREQTCASRARKQERIEATRKPVSRRARLLSRRRATLLTSTVVDG